VAEYKLSTGKGSKEHGRNRVVVH